MFDLPKDFVDGFRNALGGDKIELPFSAPFFWWMTGQASAKAQGGAAYFGGWGASSENFEQCAADVKLPIPENFTKITLANREGHEYDAYTARSIAAALIAVRRRWIIPQDGKAGRGHVQMLVFMGVKKGKAIEPWGPAVLSAKGLSARALEDAFRDYDRRTAAARRQFAAGLPFSFFYCPVGTFGNERQAVNVGKPGAQSPITPPVTWTPDTINESFLQTWYVGNQTAQEMAQLKADAAEWLAAWKNGKGDDDGAPDVQPVDVPQWEEPF